MKRILSRIVPLILLALTVVPTFQAALVAIPFNSFEGQKKTDETNEDVLKLLEKIDPNGFYPLEKTLGFKYAWASRWTSPYKYTILLQDLSSQKPVPVVRIEGNAADVISFSRVFTYEKIVKSEPDDDLVYEKLQPKYHVIGQGLNLLHPSLGVLYASYRSPSLTTGQTLSRGLTYFLVDGFLLWAAGRNGFRDRFDPAKHAAPVAAALLLTRGFGAFQQQALVRGHNNFAEAGYSFSLDSY